jgi:hypothetical protein
MSPAGQRREIRVAQAFFEMLDLQLRPDRGLNGEPSATDFLVIDLPEILERSRSVSMNCPNSSKTFGRRGPTSVPVLWSLA